MKEVKENQLAKVENMLNVDQLNTLLSKTPSNHKYQRPAKGGGKWDYVTGVYVKKVLNLIFGYDWDFTIDKFEYNMDAKQCIVLGRLAVRCNQKEVIKMQFGRSDIKFKKDSKQPLDLGNDLKAATTDALKKCASELGVASDIYGANEFTEIKIIPTLELSELEIEVKAKLEMCNSKDDIDLLFENFSEHKEDKKIRQLFINRTKEIQNEKGI